MSDERMPCDCAACMVEAEVGVAVGTFHKVAAKAIAKWVADEARRRGAFAMRGPLTVWPKKRKTGGER